MEPPGADAIPDAGRAREIARSVLGEPVRELERFATGLQHWVYDVRLASGRRAVLRIASPPNRPALVGAVTWQRELRPLGLPVAGILHADLDAPLPYLVLERLPGTDLGHVYRELSPRQRRDLAAEVAALQERTAALPQAAGYGYALDRRSRLASTWAGVLRGSLRRSRRWIQRSGAVDEAWADRVETALARSADDFADVRPRAFLHDTTTKNVIVHEGRLSGIVDVDSMAFGDPLWTVALTRMSLLASRDVADYVDAWCEAMGPGAAASERLDLYTALHGLAFLGELGQAFNRDAPAAVDPDERAHLEQIVAGLIGS